MYFFGPGFWVVTTQSVTSGVAVIRYGLRALNLDRSLRSDDRPPSNDRQFRSRACPNLFQLQHAVLSSELLIVISAIESY